MPVSVQAPAPGVTCPVSGRYLELRTGESWTYRVTNAKGSAQKTQTVGDIEDIGGAKAYRLTTTKRKGVAISWQRDDGVSVTRHREQDRSGKTYTDEIYQPFRLRFDGNAEHLVNGAKWSQSYTEIVTDTTKVPPVTTMADKTESWEVRAVDEMVSVPAGDFCALRVHRISSVGESGGSDKTYWFARGIGKIKETGAHQTEELTEYAAGQP
jgi:hypothetical protein